MSAIVTPLNNFLFKKKITKPTVERKVHML